MSTEQKPMKVHCNKCQGKTNHDVLSTHNETWSDEDVWEEDIYSTVKCRGCDAVSFYKKSMFSEDYDIDDRGNMYYNENITVYPPRIARRIPDWHRELNIKLQGILGETYAALQDGSKMLAAMGARAALEMLMTEKIDDQGSFAKNVKEFIKQGYMQPMLERPLLDALDVGSATIHRGYAPTDKVLEDLFDVIEGIINSTLILPNRANKLQKTTPQRPMLIRPPAKSEQ